MSCARVIWQRMIKLIQDRTIRKYILQFVLILNFVVLFWLVWTPAEIVSTTMEISTGNQFYNLPTYLDWIGNFLLLVPTAFLMRRLWEQLLTRTIGIALFSLSCIIELVQFQIPGRDPDWRDVTVNSLGAILFLRYSDLKAKVA